MGRIAVVANGDPGHALPALGVAAALEARGHDVRFISSGAHEETAAAHGLVLHPLPTGGAGEGDGGFGDRLWTRAAATAAPLATSLRGWGPQLVVADTLTRCGAFAAQLLDVPWLEIVPHHLVDPADDLPPIGLGRRPARRAVRRADDRRIVRLQRRSLTWGEEQAARAAALLGLRGVTPPVLRLIATLPGLERARRSWPGDAHVVGPLALDPAVAQLDLPPGDDPLVVVTDSTAAGVGRGIGSVALSGLAGLDIRLVVTAATLAPRQDRRVTVGRGPHRPLLAEASLAVGFGGAGFVTKALAAGVPLVVAPLQGDQREAAARLRDAGAGRMVPIRALRPTMLRWAVVRQLHDADAAAAARRLSREAAQLGPQLAADLVDAALAGAVAPAGGPRHHLTGP